jgi:NAD(P)-dependent dehydrogenase (short-subunit alcohol dehydrogenase family)
MNTSPKVAIITGGSQGIGAGLVTAYRALGFRVVATSRSITQTDDADLIAVPGDIADPSTASRVVATALERFGRIDTLVNNAGVFVSKPFTEYSVEDFERLYATNVGGFFHLTQRAAEVMLEAGSGHIATITTSLVEQPDEAVPAALASLTKGGLQAATQSLAIEFAGRGVRVNAVAPGYIKTAINPEATHATLAGMHPLDRMGEISDVVAAVMYLESADFITGEVLHVDGGQTVGRTAA